MEKKSVGIELMANYISDEYKEKYENAWYSLNRFFDFHEYLNDVKGIDMKELWAEFEKQESDNQPTNRPHIK